MEIRIGPVLNKEEVLAFPDGPSKFEPGCEYRIVERQGKRKSGVLQFLARIHGEDRWLWKVYAKKSIWYRPCVEAGCWKDPCRERVCSAHLKVSTCTWKGPNGETCDKKARKDRGGLWCGEHMDQDVKKTMLEYGRSEVGKASHRKYLTSEKGKKAHTRYRKTENGREIARKMRGARSNRKYATDPCYRLEHLLRGRLRNALNAAKAGRKSARTLELLDCTIQEFRAHIESLFQEGMTWNNMGHGEGKWVLDHHFPCDHFTLTEPSHQRVCFHWRNVRPLWDKENGIKSNKMPDDVTDEVLIDMVKSLNIE